MSHLLYVIVSSVSFSVGIATIGTGEINNQLSSPSQSTEGWAVGQAAPPMQPETASCPRGSLAYGPWPWGSGGGYCWLSSLMDA